MTRLVLVRHSTPVIDPALPAAAWALSPDGERAAADLADKLCELAPSASLVTSPEPKARGTAAIIAARLGARVHVDDGLREHERASVGFLSKMELEDSVERLLARPSELVFGDETADAVFARFEAAVQRARLIDPKRELQVITHGRAMSIYVGRMLGVDPLDFWRGLATPMAVVLGGPGIEVVTAAGAVGR